MKLLLDENLSRRIIAQLAELFPGSVHVSSEELLQASDLAVWEYAKASDFPIVTADANIPGVIQNRGNPLTLAMPVSTLNIMEIDLTAEQEAQLSQIAAQEGKRPGELAREVLLRGLDLEVTCPGPHSQNDQGQQAVARILELRQGNNLPPGVSIQDFIREGRA